MASRKDELEYFKSNIDLVKFAESYGFQVDTRKSSKNNFILFNHRGQKLAITQRSNGHWTYLDVGTETGGTIIDFIQAIHPKSLGEVRKVLRQWKESPRYWPTEPRPSAKSRDIDHDQVVNRWNAAKPISSQIPFLDSRSIPYSTIADPIFQDRLRIDHRSNLLFPHWNLDGKICGFEIKNQNFTGFATGGSKGLWCSRPRDDDQVAVFFETGLDALSFATLFSTHRKRFFSFAGRLNSHQPLCIQSAVDKMPVNSQVWLAMDHDEAGLKLAGQLREIISRVDVRILEKLPERQGDDWNDVLCAKSQKHIVASPHCR